MSFWIRVRQSKPKLFLFSNELRSCHTLHKVPCAVNRTFSSRSFIADLNNHNLIARNFKLEFFCSVRFFAAPVQAIQKKEEKDTSERRLNEQITTQFLRLVSDEGHRIISRSEALELAKHLKLDLVEVDRNAKPPVCKIFDYHREKYVRQMKDKERAKNKSELKTGPFKEVRFAAKINKKDLQLKADTVKRLMESGHRVKCTAIEATEDLDLETLLSRFSSLIKDVAFEESEPKVEKKQAFVVVRHIKFGSSKKGSGKKASKAAESTDNSLSMDNVSTLNSGSSTKRMPLKENEGTWVAGMETGHEPGSEELLDENGETNKSEWALLHGGDDFNAVFDMEDDVNVLARAEQSGTVSGKLPLEKNFGLVIESAPVHAASPIPMAVPKQGIDNRYARDPRSWNPSKIPTATYNRDARNTMNRVPQSPDHGKLPQFSMNPSFQMKRERFEAPVHEASKQASSHPSVSHSSIDAHDPTAKKPMDRVFQAPNQRTQRQINMNIPPQLRTPVQVEVPPFQVPRQDSSHPSIHDSPAKSYGNFSSQQVVNSAREQSRPAENNRYMKRDTSDPTRSRNPTVGSPYRNTPTPDLRIGGAGFDKVGEGRWR